MLTAPPATNGPTPTTKVDPKMDLLSGDDFGSPKADSLALVPVSGQQPITPVSQQNALALMDMFGSDNAPNSVNVASQINPSPPQFQQQQNFQASQGGFYSNGSAPNMGAPQYEQSQYTQGAGPAWNGQVVQSQQPPSPGYGALFNKLFSLALHLHSFAYKKMQSWHDTSLCFDFFIRSFALVILLVFYLITRLKCNLSISPD